VFGRRVAQLARALDEATGDATAQAARFDAFFRERLDVTDGKRALWSLVSAIADAGGQLRIDELCRARGLAIRQVDRLFRAHAGMGPKTFGRIVRFQKALKILMRAPGCTLADVAARCGYYDQPHLVREFKAFSGSTPRQKVGYFPSEAPTDFSPNLV